MQPLDCPVCPRRDLPADTPSCPNCGTDLSLLQRVRSLADGPGEVVPSVSRKRALLLARIAALVGLGLVSVLLAVSLRLRRMSEELDVLRNRQTATVTLSETTAPEPPAETGEDRIAWWQSRASETEDLVLEVGSQGLVLGFREPLFARGSEVLTPRGRALLMTIAAALKDQPVPLTVTVIGYTDAATIVPGGRWPDNWTLGLARASSAAGFLRKHTGAASVALRVTSASGSVPPGASALGDTASRSVALVLDYTAPTTSEDREEDIHPNPVPESVGWTKPPPPPPPG